MKPYLPNLDNLEIQVKSESSNDFIESIPANSLVGDVPCIYLLNNLIPYILTFFYGGRFPWMELEDQNSVHVGCPNPVGNVAVTISKINALEGRFIKAVVNSVGGWCPADIKAGDAYNLTPGIGIKHCLSLLDIAIPWMTLIGQYTSRNHEVYSPVFKTAGSPGYSPGSYRIVRKSNQGKRNGGIQIDISSCCTTPMEISLKLETFLFRCRYHKYPRRDKFSFQKISPEGMCIDLFHAAYPFSIAMIYKANISERKENTYLIPCPSGKASVTARIIVRNDRFYYIKQLAMFVLKKFGIAKEIPDQICEYEIISVSGTCPLNHNVGQKFKFNMWTYYTICPATMDSMYPVLHNTARGAAIPWQGSEKHPNAPLRCPDPNGALTFSVNKDFENS